jgi:hypothetical protein
LAQPNEPFDFKGIRMGSSFQDFLNKKLLGVIVKTNGSDDGKISTLKCSLVADSPTSMELTVGGTKCKTNSFDFVRERASGTLRLYQINFELDGSSPLRALEQKYGKGKQSIRIGIDPRTSMDIRSEVTITNSWIRPTSSLEFRHFHKSEEDDPYKTKSEKFTIKYIYLPLNQDLTEHKNEELRQRATDL